jgi:hypothetical protein
MFQKFEDLKSTLRFFRYNPHSIPGIRAFLCRMGRHDYEATSLNLTETGAILRCFYCQHKKNSFFCE